MLTLEVSAPNAVRDEATSASRRRRPRHACECTRRNGSGRASPRWRRSPSPAAGSAPAPRRRVSLLVTQGFGAQTVVSDSATEDRRRRHRDADARAQREGRDDLRRRLRRKHRRPPGGGSSDWFYYVNGVQASKGAAETKLHDGDHVWWDRHDWSAADSIPAVVGSFPEPFVDGYGGRRYPAADRVHPDTDEGVRGGRAHVRGDNIEASSAACCARSTTSRCASSSGPTRR
jgi:hypothetical protein